MSPKSKGSLEYSYSEILKLNIKLEEIDSKNDVAILKLIKLCKL